MTEVNNSGAAHEANPVTRRDLLKAGASLAVLGGISAPYIARAADPFILAPLTYGESELAPVISANTIGFHYHKHHQGCIDNLNKLTPGTPYADMKVKDIIKATYGQPDKIDIYNNAAQAWNHDFYWRSMKPNGGGEPPSATQKLILGSFDSLDAFKQEFIKVASSQFGSGWVWVVAEGAGWKNGRSTAIKIIKTSNADTPLTMDLRPLLVVDVWEHAYYLDYQNKRTDYVSAVVDKLLNWEYAQTNLMRLS